MDKLFSNQATLETDADFEATWEQYMTEIRRLNELMKQDQAEIERLKAEAQVLKVEAQDLKAEAQILRSETRAIIQSMEQSLKC